MVSQGSGGAYEISQRMTAMVCAAGGGGRPHFVLLSPLHS